MRLARSSFRPSKRRRRTFDRASSALLVRLGSEQTYFGGDTPGYFGVLHTWGRTLSYHPHICYIVPAGAFDSRTHQWHPCPKVFYAPARVLSTLMKARMFAMMRRAGLRSELPTDAFEKDWNVDCRPVGSGVRALRYLSASVFLNRYQRQAYHGGHRVHRHLRLYRHDDANQQADGIHRGLRSSDDSTEARRRAARGDCRYSCSHEYGE